VRWLDETIDVQIIRQYVDPADGEAPLGTD